MQPFTVQFIQVTFQDFDAWEEGFNPLLYIN